MDSIKLKALAKINLGLDVIGKREDGYHEVRMIMQTIHLYDQLEIKKVDGPGISMDANLDFLPLNENNLIVKAAKLMQETYSMKEGVHVSLKKYIPVSAGMAGGSTDAAAVLYGMNELFGLGAKRRKNRGGRAILPYARNCPGRGNRGEVKEPAPRTQMPCVNCKAGN